MKSTSSKKKVAAAERRAEYEAWYAEQVRLGIEDLDAGRVVSHEEAKKHMERFRAKLMAEDERQRAA